MGAGGVASGEWRVASGEWRVASGDENTRKDSMDLHYCKGLLLGVYHSNVRRGSGVN